MILTIASRAPVPCRVAQSKKLSNEEPNGCPCKESLDLTSNSTKTGCPVCAARESAGSLNLFRCPTQHHPRSVLVRWLSFPHAQPTLAASSPGGLRDWHLPLSQEVANTDNDAFLDCFLRFNGIHRRIIRSRSWVVGQGLPKDKRRSFDSAALRSGRQREVRVEAVALSPMWK
jgi:hypothetical protein